MPRTARAIAPGIPHLVTQRGNNQQDVFFVDDDRKNYLSLLGKYAGEQGLRILGYCLMTNHVHIAGIPAQATSLAYAIGRTHLVYTQYINRLHQRSGHLWQNRFHSCPLDEEHLWYALRYVDQNPVRAGMVSAPWEYSWSSAAAHISGEDSSRLIDMVRWREMTVSTDWKDLLSQLQSQDQLARLRYGISRGRPLGSDSFVSKLEAALGRRLRPLPEGRPRTRSLRKN
jgi:putative transposase